MELGCDSQSGDINAARNMLIMNLAMLKDILESSRNATAQIVGPVS